MEEITDGPEEGFYGGGGGGGGGGGNHLTLSTYQVLLMLQYPFGKILGVTFAATVFTLLLFML